MTHSRWPCSRQEANTNEHIILILLFNFVRFPLKGIKNRLVPGEVLSGGLSCVVLLHSDGEKRLSLSSHVCF